MPISWIALLITFDLPAKSSESDYTPKTPKTLTRILDLGQGGWRIWEETEN
jgi:hypothetical protein